MEMETMVPRDRGSMADATAAHTRVWTLHGDQRLVGVCCEQNAASLVASGERHVQIRSLSQTTTVGKLVPFESEQSILQPAQGLAQRFYVSYPRIGGSQGRVRLLDAVAMEFEDLGGGEDASASSSGRPTDTYDVQDACVDAEGRYVALLETQKEGDERTAAWRLRGWSRTDHERRGVWTTTPLQPATGEQHAWAMRFMNTTLLGECLMAVCLARNSTEWALQQQLFSVSDGGWTLLVEQRGELQLPSDSAYQLQLSSSCQWLALYTRGAQQLTCVPLDLFGSQRPPLSVEVGAPVADVAWRDDVLAVLSTSGRLHFRRPQSSGLVQAAASIDVSALVHTVAGEWHRIVWTASGDKLLVGFGSSVVEVSVTLDPETPTLPPTITRPTETFEMSTPPHRRRRRRRPQPKASASLSRDIERIVASPAFESTLVELLDATRFTIQSAALESLDVAFTLLGILLQRVLRRLGFVDTNNADDLPIQIGIMEMLVAQVVTGDAIGVHQIAETVTQAPAFRSRIARRSYYARELQWLAARRGGGLAIDGLGSSCPSFIESALDQVTELLNEASVSSISEPVSRERSTQDARDVLSKIERATSAPASPWLRLQALVLSCAAACDFYQIDSVVLDVDLLRAIPSQLHRKPRGRPAFLPNFVRRFLSPQFAKLRVHAAPSVDETPSLASAALRLADRSGFLGQLVQFCSALDVSDPYALLVAHQLHCHNKKHTRQIEPRLSRATAKAVIDQGLADLVAMLRHAPLLPPHRSCDAETKQSLEASASVDQFVKLVFVSTDPSAALSDDTNRLGLPPSSLHPSEGETLLRTNTLRLVRLVVQQLRHLMRFASNSPSPVNSETAMDSVLRDLFLFDSLWAARQQPSAVTTGTSPREAMLFLQGLGPSQSVVYGRVGGATMTSEGAIEALSPHFLRALRALVLVLWAHWIRERCSVVKSMLEDRAKDQDAEGGQRLGAMAAWCALHLKTLALYRDETDQEELLALQLWLLDAAASLDPQTTSRVLQWGFAADSINARYQRRFRVLRAAVADYDSSDDAVIHFKRCLRAAVRRGSQSGDDSDHSALEELDAVGTCCCDGDFQRVVWALVQRRFLVMSSPESHGFGTDGTEIKKALQSRPSSVDGLISRHEVVQLLKAQRLEIEQQMQRVQKATVETAPPASQPATPPPRLQADVRPQPTVSASRLKSYSVRDLMPSPLRVDEKEQRSESPTKSYLRKGSSTQNVLKLLQLRKDHHQQIVRHQSAPRLVPVALPSKQDPTAKVSAPTAPSQPTPMPVRKKPTQPRPPPPPPLRREPTEQTEHAELVLLTATSGGPAKHKSVPLTRKSFQLETIPPVNGLSHLYQIPLDADDEPERLTSRATQCTTLKTTSVQTEAEKDEETLAAAPTTCAASTSSLDKPAVGASEPPKKEDVGVQAHSVEPANDAHDERLAPQYAASLAARFPVYVDLPGPAASANSGFLHVAAMPAERVAAQRKSQERVKIVRTQATEPRATEATEKPATTSNEIPESHNEAENSDEKLKRLEAQRRQTYRSRFPPAAAHNRGGASGSSVGMESFVSLKSEMERMKAKLQELEMSARDLDDEFKVSHETLDTMERRRATHVLAQVDDAVAESAGEELESAQPRGVLSAKATRDLAGARHLLTQIEQLTALNSERGNAPHT